MALDHHDGRDLLRHWLVSQPLVAEAVVARGLETLAIGMLAASVAYLIGGLLKGLV